PSQQDEVSVLDRTQAYERRSRPLAVESQGACRLLVAGLDRMDQGAGCDRSAGARAGRRQAHADRGCARKLRQSAGLTAHVTHRTVAACENARVAGFELLPLYPQVS